MSTATLAERPFSEEIPSELEADTEAVMTKLLTGKPLDPQTYRRIRERAERITEEVRRKQGTLNIAVDLVHQVRDAQ